MKNLLLLLLLCLPLLSQAQTLTYERVLSDGKAQYDALDYEDAIKKFEAGKLLAKTTAQQTEIAGWLDRAKDGRLNALKYALAVSDRLRNRADSALAVANRVLDQMYFYEGKFGLTLKNVEENYRSVYRYGFIDRNGREVIPFEFEEATPFSTTDGFARVKNKGRKYLLDTAGIHYLLAESLEELKPETEALDLHESFPEVLPESLGSYVQLRILLSYRETILSSGLNPFEPSGNGKTGKLIQLPKGFGTLRNLEVLNLNRNHLSELPETFGQLTQLKTLDLSDNKLIVLPESFGQLSQLQSLDLGQNQLSELPKTFGQLSQLQSLDLGGNQLSALPPEFGQLQNLQALTLTRNQLTTLPPQFGQLQNLQSLSLIGNQLSSLPPQFGQLQNLQSLYLSSNRLDSLSHELFELQNLQELDIRGNNLSSLPPQFGQLKNLQTLDLSRNQLTTLPPQIGQLGSLEQLELRANPWITFPQEVSQLKKIKQLDFSHQQWDNIPEGLWHFSHLETLYLEGNQLIALPPEIGQLQNLQSLYLRNNQLTTLPPEIGQLQNLKKLSISRNQLTTLPPEIGQLKQLENLDLRNNPLSELEVDSLRTALPDCNILTQSQAERLAEIKKTYLANQSRYQKSCAAIEAQLAASQAIDSTSASNSYNSLAWYSLLLGEFETAEAAIRRGMELDSTNLYLYTNLPPILLFQGQVQEAKKLYQEWMDRPFGRQNLATYRGAFKDDFEEFEKTGIIPETYLEEVEEIKQMLQTAESTQGAGNKDH